MTNISQNIEQLEDMLKQQSRKRKRSDSCEDGDAIRPAKRPRMMIILPKTFLRKCREWHQRRRKVALDWLVPLLTLLLCVHGNQEDTTDNPCRDETYMDCKLADDTTDNPCRDETYMDCKLADDTTDNPCRDETYMDCKLADDIHDICAERTLAAVKYCQKYCGYCSADGSTLPPPSGTTVDTCKDNGDLDCKKMNDLLHVCAKKDSPPTVLYCPKFCGLCTSSVTTHSVINITEKTTNSAATTTIQSSAEHTVATISTPSVGTTAPTSTGSGTSSLCRDEIYMDCKLADNAHSICAERTPAAVKYCQKYCGYCSADGSTLPPPTGTTVDTCMDSGDLDCKKMNDLLNICAKKDSPPTLLYCPKFCGLCTFSVTTPSLVTIRGTASAATTTIPSSATDTAATITTPSVGPTTALAGSGTSSLCRDEIYMDCKLADDAHNICAERTPAAVKYCQKYCGYCSADGSTLPPPTGTTVDTCKDSGDLDCKKMNDLLNICALKDSPPTVLYCPKFCGICSPSYEDKVTTAKGPEVTTVPKTTQLTTEMRTQMLTKQVTVVQPTTQVTAPSTTLSAFTSPPPKTLPPVTTTCAVCAGPKVLCEQLFVPTPCSPPNNYCINTVMNHKDGTKTVDRACGNFEACYRDWFQGSSDIDICRKFDGKDEERLDFQCTFCCIEDNCNIPLRPADNTLYTPV